MGIRSNNYIAIKPGIALTYAFLKFFSKDNAEMIETDAGRLIVYETNFTPMWARQGVNCTFDLEQEIAVQQFLGSLNPEDFCMRRAGEQTDYRGKWTKHAFKKHKLVREIDQTYDLEIGINAVVIC